MASALTRGGGSGHRQLAASIAIASLLAGSAAALQPAVDETLVSYAFDEGAGTVAGDESGNGRHASVAGATWTTTGRYGNGLSFDGVNDRVIGPSVTLGPAFTLMAWIYNPSNSAYETILTVGSARDIFLASGVLTVDTGNGEWPFGPALPTNVWQHVAITYTGTALQAYVNGVARGTPQTTTLGSATGALQVGAWISGPSSVDFFGGTIDEVRVYNRALTVQEIQADQSTPIGGSPTDTTPPVRSNGQPSGTLAAGTSDVTLSLVTDENATCRYATTANVAYGAMTTSFSASGGVTHTSPRSGLSSGSSYAFYVRCQDAAGNANNSDFPITFSIAGTEPSGSESAAYAFEEGAGTVAGDESGNGRHASVVGATWTTTGRYGNGLSFDGVNDRVIGPSVTLGPAFTLMAWIYNPSNSAYETILTVGSARDVFLASGVLTVDTGNGEWTFGSALSTNVWQHVAITYTGTTLQAYVNGVARGTPRTVTLGTVTGALQVGAWISGTSSVDFFGGTIDEVRVYNRALTAQEIQADQSTPIGGGPMDTTPPVRSNGQPSGTLAAGTSDVTLSLATDENATCRYATTANVAYGAMTTSFSASGGVTHTSPRSGLSSGSSYAFYVRCQDAAGNANNSDFVISFSVASPTDTTPPSVAMSSPAPGTTVSGNAAISATASDNVGVSGVQFILDGVNLGPEDTAAPWAITWDTTTAPDGSHQLQAAARDAAGNRTFSTVLAVSTDNSPTGSGFALRFTGNGYNVNRVDIRLDGPARPVDVGATDFTIEWWMKVAVGDVTANSCQTGRDAWINGDIFIDQDVNGAGDNGDYGLSLFRNGLAFGVSRGSTGGGICGATDLADNQWHHVAVTRRQSDGRLQIFVDGRLDASGSGPAGDVSYRDNRSSSKPQSDPFLVFGAEKHAFVPALFRGTLDEIRLSTVLRYNANFVRPSAPFGSDANTAALYHFDEGQGTTINDASGATGGPSLGVRRSGGSPAGPAWVSDTPFD